MQGRAKGEGAEMAAGTSYMKAICQVVPWHDTHHSPSTQQADQTETLTSVRDMNPPSIKT